MNLTHKVSIPLKSLYESLDKLVMDKHKTIFVLCGSGNRATTTTAYLITKGYNAVVITGGIGIVLGIIIYTLMYQKLTKSGLFITDKFSEYSLFHKITGNPLKVTLPISAVLVLVMVMLESVGF